MAKMCACEKLMSLSLWTCDALVLNEALKPIHEAGIEFPTELKMSLLQRRLKDIGNVRATATVDDVRTILLMVTHWQKSGLEPLDFDSFHPALCAIEGSHVEKADAMLSCIVDRLVAPALLLGEEGAGVLKLIAEEGKKLYGSVPDDVPDEYITVVSVMLRTFRAILSLLDRTSTAHAKDVQLLSDAASSAKGLGAEGVMLRKIGLVAVGVPFYKDLIVDFMKTKEATQQLSTRWASILVQIKKGSVADPTVVFGALEEYEKHGATVRSGLAKELLDGIVEQVQLLKDKFQKERDSGFDTEDVEERSKRVGDYVAFFRKAGEVLDHEHAIISDVLADAGKLDRAAKNAIKVAELTSQFEEITVEWLRAADIDTLSKKGELAFLGEFDCVQKRDIADVASALLDFASELEFGTLAMKACVDIYLAIINTSFFIFSEGVRKQLMFLEACHGFAENLATWNLLGISTLSRAAADTTNVAIRNCLQRLARAEGAVMHIADNTLIKARAFVEEGALTMRAVGEELVARENEEIKKSADLLEATMQGVVGPKKNWKDKLGDAEVTFLMLRKLADKTLLNMKFEKDRKLSDVVGLAENLLVKAEHVAQVHSVKLAPGVMDRHAANLKEARVGVWEAKVLLGAEKFEDDSGKLRKFAIKMRQDCWSVCSSLLI